MWKNQNSPHDSDSRLLRTTFQDDALLDCHGDSTIGRLRKVNQDRYFFMALPLKTTPGQPEPKGYLLGVADGVGGAPAGERASLLAVGTLKAFVAEESSRLLQTGHKDAEIVETFNRGLRRCQSALAEEVNHHPEYRGMGTTLTAAVVLWPRLYVFHMGDSRAYLLRDGILRRLTQDQTYARTLMDAGVLDAGTASRSRWKHVVWNVLGGKKASRHNPEVHPAVHIEDLHGNDVLLLCTDGLFNPLTDETIRDHLLKGGSSEDLCRSLTDSAREMKAQDDATLVVARFTDPREISG